MMIINSNIPQTSTNSTTFFTKIINMFSYEKIEDILNVLISDLNKNKISENNYQLNVQEDIKKCVKNLISFSFYKKKDVHNTFKEFNQYLEGTEHQCVWTYLCKSSFVDNLNSMKQISSSNAHQLGEVQIFLSEQIHEEIKQNRCFKLEDVRFNSINCLDLYVPTCYESLNEEENYILHYIHEAELNLLNDVLKENEFDDNLKVKLKKYVIENSTTIAYNKLMLNKEVYQFSQPLVLDSLLEALKKDPNLHNSFYTSLSSFLKSDMLIIYQTCLNDNVNLSTLEISTLIEMKNKHFDVCDFLFNSFPSLLKEQSIIRTFLELHLQDCEYATEKLNNKTDPIDLTKINLNKNDFKTNNNELIHYIEEFSHDIMGYLILTNNTNYYKLITLNQFKDYDINNCWKIINLLEEKKVSVDTTLFEKIQLEQKLTPSTTLKNKIKI
jgi:hypothetical protein